MQFEIRSRWSGAVVFTAEIAADSETPTGIKLGLAVKTAVKAGANLRGANLSGANLRGADLSEAYLSGASLNGVSGLNDWIKCIQVEDWPISYTSEVMQIGCQRHTFDAWKNFSDAQIRAMDGRRALTFWAKWKETIFKIIEMAPASSTASANTQVSASEDA